MLLISSREILDFLHFSCKAFLLFCLFKDMTSANFNYVSISATKEDTCFLLMVFEVAHAHPAIFVLTVVTRHMHAPFFLFNWRLAFGTRPTVDFKPILGVVLTHSDTFLPFLK